MAAQDDLIRLLQNPMDLPIEFKTWLTKYIEVNPPSLPLSQMLGIGHVLDAALAVPVLRAEAGGSIVAAGVGASAGSYVCNMDSTVKAAGTLGNQVLSTFLYEAALDAPPPGYKTQWAQEVIYTTNAGSPAVTLTWSMWQMTGIGGAAGGYTESMAASLASSLNVAKSFAGVALGGGMSGWSDSGAVGGLDTSHVYAFAVNNNGTFAASSACRWRARLYRRFVPAS